jgi:CBS domain-containing protein
MKVSDLMTRQVEFIAADATVEDAAVLMGELDVGALPVGDHRQLVGIVTDRDILFRVVAEGRDPARTRVGEIATRRVVTCSPDDDYGVALELMASHNIRRLPVRDEAGTVLGWITLSDLARRLLIDSGTVQKGLQGLGSPAAEAPAGGSAPAAPAAPPAPPVAPAR